MLHIINYQWFWKITWFKQVSFKHPGVLCLIAEIGNVLDNGIVQTDNRPHAVLRIKAYINNSLDNERAQTGSRPLSIPMVTHFNKLGSDEFYMHKKICRYSSSCCLFGANPSPDSMVTNCQLIRYEPEALRECRPPPRLIWRMWNSQAICEKVDPKCSRTFHVSFWIYPEKITKIRCRDFP